MFIGVLSMILGNIRICRVSWVSSLSKLTLHKKNIILHLM